MGEPDAKAVHDALLARAAELGLSKSALQGSVSSHELRDTVGIEQLRKLRGAGGGAAYLGSLRDRLVFSVHVGRRGAGPPAGPPAAAPASRKRKADTAEDDAAASVARVRKAAGADSVDEHCYEQAAASMARLLRLRGAAGERVVESAAVSLRGAGQFGHAPAAPGKTLVVACRLAGGVAMDLGEVCDALHGMEDGMVSVDAASVADFALPASEQGAVARERGARCVFLFLSTARAASKAK
jgi:hypothetical protein